MEAAAHPWPTLGVLMLRDGLVSKEELEAILDEQRDSRQQRMSGHRLGEVLIERGLATPTDVAKLVAEQYELPFTELDTTDIELRVAYRLGEELARRLSAIPISTRSEGSCVLAIADPATVLFSDELRRVLGSSLQFVVVGPDAMEAAIAYVFDRDEEPQPLAAVPEPHLEGALPELREEHPGAADAPNELSALTDHPSPAMHHSPPLGALLVREGLVSEDELDAALAQQRLSTSWRLGEILVNRGAVTPAAIARVIAEQYELQFVDLENAYVDPAVVGRLPREIARNFPAVPIAESADGSLQVAIADPTNVYYSDELQDALGVKLTFVVASPDAIDAVIESVHEPEHELLSAVELEEVVARTSDDLPDDTHAAPVVTDAVAEEPGVESDHFAAIESVHEPEHELLSAVELEEVVARTGDDLPDDTHAAPVVTDPVAEEPGVESDHFAAALQEEVVADASVEEIRAEPEHAEASEEGVTTVEPLAGEETVGDEPILGWLPTWTTEIQLDADEPALGDEPGAVAPVEDDLSTALLAEVAPSDAPTAVNEIEDDEAPPTALHHWAHDDEVASTEPAPVISLVEYAFVEDEIPEDEDVEYPDTASPVDEPVELDATTSTPSLEIADLAVEEVLRLGATAVHFSPNDGEYIVRARIDGTARELGVVPNDDVDRLVERFQSLVEMRVHVMPTTKGEKVTLFPLDRTTAPTQLADLGLTEETGATVREALARPSGALVVCGPVGSGTTTTLYAALDALNTPDRVVATIEDTIDRVLDGVDQMEVDVATGRTFAEGLRTVLATDSDVVLVGEIGDRETAEVAFAGALAGRYLLSALRAPSAAAAIRGLLDLGVEPYRLCDALTCVVAQRLVRRVCLDCRETYYATESELAELGQPLEDAGPRLLARGRGCESCDGTGFRGRVGIFEVLSVTDDVRELVGADASTKKLERAARAGGMRTLREEAVRLCLDGMTTSAELRRVLGTGP